MDLQSKGLFHVDSTLGKYLPALVDSTDYENLTLKQILTHQAGLVSWIPFFIKTLDDGQPSYELYSKLPSSIHQNRVADDLYMLSSYRDTIFKRIINTRVKTRKKNSYTNKLLKLGTKKIAQKFGEESSELIIDFLKGSKKRTIEEAVDVIYHLLILLKSKKITIDEIHKELDKRK